MIVIPRAPDGVNFGGTLGWAPVTYRVPGGHGEVKAQVCCPRGHLMALRHDVADDGAVTPSIVCRGYTGRGAGPEAYEPCDWHVFARLDGWLP